MQQIESGQRRLTAEELVVAVREVDVPLDIFTSPLLIAGEARFSWRRDADTPVSDLDAFERQAGEWIGTYGELRAMIGDPVSPIVHRLNLTRASSYEDATDSGEAVARLLELGPVPSRDLAQAMYDRMSILVLMVDAGEGISGAACLVRNLGAVLVNRNEIPGQRSYDLAHELFHILTWDAMPPERLDDGEGSGKLQKRVETMAEKFASALLMPSWLLRSMTGDATDPAWLNATATGLGVSAKALKWRMVDLGRIDRETARAYDDDLLVNNGGLVSGDRELLKFGRPFMDVMAAAILQGHISVCRTAEPLAIPVDGLGELFEAHGITRPFDI